MAEISKVGMFGGHSIFAQSLSSKPIWDVGSQLRHSFVRTALTTIRHAFIMRCWLLIPLFLGLSACASAVGGYDYTFQPQPGQGQYVRPAYLDPAPTPRLPAIDPCQSQMYLPLVGVNEGAIYIPGLPGQKRIIRPAVFEGADNDFLNGEMMTETYVQVQNYLPGQQLYAPSISDVSERITIGVEDTSRLTIELDREGYVQEIRCG